MLAIDICSSEAGSKHVALLRINFGLLCGREDWVWVLTIRMAMLTETEVSRVRRQRLRRWPSQGANPSE
jgi:hypothetical protein